MKKILITIWFLVISVLIINAQNTRNTWERIFGGEHRDQAFSVQQADDGSYIVAGFTGSFGHGCYDAYVVKTNAFGDTLWTKTYGTTNNDYCWSTALTNDGGYALLGANGSILQTGPYDLYFVKIDAFGDTLWTAVYGDTTSIGQTNDVGNDVQQTQDGGYILVGSTESFGAGYYDVYLVKTNSQGDTLWTRTYGTTNTDFGEAVLQTQDGGYIIAGSSYVNAYLVRTDGQGDTLWTKTYGIGEAWGVCQAQDGGFVFVGTTSGGIYLVKTDSIGNVVWTKVYGNGYLDWGHAVRPTQDGGYVIVGGTRPSIDPEFCYVWLLKTDSNGDTLWTKIKQNVFANGTDVQPTQDGGYIIAAITWEYGGDDNFYLIKTDSFGLVSVEESNYTPLTYTLKQNYPNPFNPTTTIYFETTNLHENSRIEIYNIKGQKVRTLIDGKLPAGTHQVVWDGKDENSKPVSSGMYFCKMNSEGNSGRYTMIKKMILMK